MRTTKYKGVYQRCPKTCTQTRCAKHKFTFKVDAGQKPDGSTRQVTRGGFASATAARDARNKVQLKHRAGTLPKNLKLTVGEWLESWYSNKFSENPEGGTARSYRQHIDTYLVPHLGTLPIHELSVVHITKMFNDVTAERQKAHAKAVADQKRADAAWTKALQRRKNAKREKIAMPKNFGTTTKRRVKATLSCALTDAMVAEEVERNVAKLVKLPGGGQKKVKPWTPEVYGAFLDAVATERLAPMFTLAGYCGMRRGELCGLRWEDVDFDNAILTVTQQAKVVGNKIVYAPAKTEAGQDRVVYLARTEVVMLLGLKDQQQREARAWGDAYHRTGLVFVKENGEGWHPDTVTKMFPRIVIEAGFPRCRLHDLRHFHGSTALGTGVSMEVVSKMLGHSCLSITVDLYSHLPTKTGHAVAAAVAGAIPRAATKVTPSEATVGEHGPAIDACLGLLTEAGFKVSADLVAKLVAAVAALVPSQPTAAAAA